MKSKLMNLANVAILLPLLFSGKLLASSNDVVTICGNLETCSNNTKIQQFVISQAKGSEADVILVNQVKSETVLYQVRVHDFGGSEFPGMLAITAQEVAKATGSGHTNVMALVRFMNDPISSTLNQGSFPLGSLTGYPTFVLSHFEDLPHQLDIQGASLSTLNLRIQSAINNMFATRSTNLLEDVNASVSGSLSIKLRSLFEAGGSASIGGGEPVTSLTVLLKATTDEQPFGFLVKVTKNGSNLENKITGIALISNGEIVFIIPIAEDGTVDLAKLLGTSIRIDSNENFGSIRDWFRQIGFDVQPDPCLTGAEKCVIRIVDLKKK